METGSASWSQVGCQPRVVERVDFRQEPYNVSVPRRWGEPCAEGAPRMMGEPHTEEVP